VVREALSASDRFTFGSTWLIAKSTSFFVKLPMLVAVKLTKT
jgi:hypothetical protein